MNDEGAFKSRTIKKVPFEQRWKKTNVEATRHTPWRVKDPSDAPRQIIEHNPSVEIGIDKSMSIPLPPADEGESVPRRVYLKRAIVEKYGMTEHCPGCVATMLGNTGATHSDECRKRIEKEMHDDPLQREKLRETAKRRYDFVRRRMGDHTEKRARNSDTSEETTGMAPASSDNGGEPSGSMVTTSAQKCGRELGDDGDQDDRYVMSFPSASHAMGAP